MTGLDRIIARILDDAKERARVILEDARNECRAAAADYAARANAIRDGIIDRAEREGEVIINRAKSAAAMTRRQILVNARVELIDEAFRRAGAELMRDGEKYRELLVTLLTSALIEEAESAGKGAVYGDEVAEFDTFEVCFNAMDRKRYGEYVVDAARRAVRGCIGAERAGKLRLAEKDVNIDGGLILRYGSIEANCSLSVLLAEMRDLLEAKVSAVLFEAEKAES